MSSSRRAGFTLIELLVVIAIIGLLAAVVLASLNTARAKGRDARRISDLKNIQLALEMYYDQNGHYPKRNSTYTQSTTGDVCGTGWCSLEQDLRPYLSDLPRDPLGLNAGYYYYYDSDTGDNNQTYGMMIRFETASNYPLADNDKGYYNSNGSYYEVGVQPAYCRAKWATTSSGNWWGSHGGSPYPNVCAGGN